MTDQPLENLRWEAFCRYLVVGNPEHDPKPARRHDPDNPPNTRHNATKSYVAAGYKAKGHAAGVNAHRLLKKADIRSRITALQHEVQRVTSLYMRDWRALLVDAQNVLVKAMRGEEISSQAIQAAREVIRQAEGPAHLRFGPQARQNENQGLRVTLWSGRRRD